MIESFSFSQSLIISSLQLSPGCFVLVDQFIDLTTDRKKTFYDEEIIAHVSMAHPTSIDLIELCCKSLKKQNIKYKKGSTYVAIEGPHFSSKAESNLYKSWGADIIGMTNMPEAKLAKEAEIRYCTVGMVTDYDSWRFKDLIFSNEDVYSTEMNWKLAIDTFGETYHFSVLHKDSLFQSFYGNCQMFDSFKRNGRLTRM